jgi:hypothetical protein
MAERRINWGADATDAQYRTGDDESNNRFIVAEDLDAGTVLLEYDESASEWVSRGSVNVDGNDVSNVGALDAQSASIDRANVAEPRGGAMPNGQLSFSTEFVTDLFSDGYTDPLIFHREHFVDGDYRVIVHNTNTGEIELHTTTEFNSFTQESSDLGYFSAGGGTNFQDHVVLDDGTFVLYDSLSDTDTRVWTGSDLTSLTNQGTVITGESDAGVYLDRPNDTIHIYTEDTDNIVSGEPTSNALSHYTTTTTNLTSATQQSNAVDVTAKDWHTGDPDIIQVGEYYYMFLDNSTTHPAYNIALARSPDLDNWVVIADNITPQKLGGDMVVVRRGGIFEALVEFSGGGNSPIGHWRLYPTPMANRMVYDEGQYELIEAETGQRRMSTKKPSNNQFDVRWHAPPNADPMKMQFLDDAGSVMANIQPNPNATTPVLNIDAANGWDYNLGIRGTGSAEISMETTGKTTFARQGATVMELYDDQGLEMEAIDLSNLSLTSTEDARIYRHVGGSSINADGGTTSSPGYYVWDNGNSEFKSIVQF